MVLRHSRDVVTPCVFMHHRFPAIGSRRLSFTHTCFRAREPTYSPAVQTRSHPEAFVVLRSMRLVAVASLVVATAVVARSQAAWGPYCGVRDSTVHTLPVSREEDRDGAWTVWSKYCRGGFHYHMTPAELVPGDPQFNRVDVPGDGYIIWWPWYMAVTAGPRGPIETREGEQPLSDFLAWFGEPTYYKLAHKLRAPDASRPTTALFVPVWKTGDPKVNIAGVMLGASRAAIAAALGDPEDSTLAEGIVTLRFPSREMEVKLAPTVGRDSHRGRPAVQRRCARRAHRQRARGRALRLGRAAIREWLAGDLRVRGLERGADARRREGARADDHDQGGDGREIVRRNYREPIAGNR